MIVEKNTKTYVKNPLFPNVFFGDEEDVYVVDDNSELAQKIESHSPYFDFVLDNEGNLIDITPTERPPTLPPEPTEAELLTDYIVDVDFRVTMIELGLI